jgi:transcriptional regulator GlxA family with amidase domain
MNAIKSPVKVAVLALPESTAFMLYAMYDLFLSAGRDWGIIVNGQPGPQLMQVQIVASTAAPFKITNQVLVEPHAGLDSVPDIVCIPDIMVSPNGSIIGHFQPELKWIKHCYANGAIIASACSGALLLAEAGLLDGFETTTHWAYCDMLKRDYPKVTVRSQRTLVLSGEGGRLVMSGAGVSCMELSLYLIARTVGVDQAMQVARLALIDWHTIGQQPYASLARSRQVDDAVIGQCQTWIAQNYHERAPVTAMANMCGLAERTFKRRFMQATGMAPLEYVHTLRIEESKQMLETSEDPIDAIANQVGYEDASFFARLFKRNVNLTPAQYRKRFSAMRKTLST